MFRYDNDDNLFKIIVIGDRDVGKTSLMYRYDQETVLVDPKNTVGLGIIRKKIEVNDDDFTLNIWDTAGQETYRAVIAPFYRYADAVILVYDVTKRSTFDSLDYWLKECQKHGVEDFIPKILIGNKCDCKNREISTEEAKMFAEQHNIPMYESSSRMDSDIEEIMNELLKRIVEYRSTYEIEKFCLYSSSQSIQIRKTKNRSTCCFSSKNRSTMSFSID